MLYIILLDPITISTRLHTGDPILIVQIPLDRFTDTCFKRFSGFPVEFAFDFARVDRIADVMTGAILDVSDQIQIIVLIRTIDHFFQ